MRLIDSHVHAYEYGEEFLSKYCGLNELVLIAVSDNYDSSLKTLKICRTCPNTLPAIGLHPWEVREGSTEEARKIIEELGSRVALIGEVGLDKKFIPNTFNKQLEVFRVFLDYARSEGKGLCVHAAGAWREVIDELSRYEIRAAIIHWYTGPKELLKDIESLGYFIGINAAAKIQRKMREIIKYAPLEIMLTESDGPYNYRGLKLGPDMIRETIGIIAKIKDIDEDEVIRTIDSNFRRFMNRLKK